MRIVRNFIVSIAMALAAFGCSLPHFAQPATPEQAQISAYATIDLAASTANRLLNSDLITVDQAEAVLAQVEEATAILEAAEAAFTIGDISTAIGQLQAAQLIVDALHAFVTKNQEAAR